MDKGELLFSLQFLPTACRLTVAVLKAKDLKLNGDGTDLGEWPCLGPGKETAFVLPIFLKCINNSSSLNNVTVFGYLILINIDFHSFKFPFLPFSFTQDSVSPHFQTTRRRIFISLLGANKYMKYRIFELPRKI